MVLVKSPGSSKALGFRNHKNELFKRRFFGCWLGLDCWVVIILRVCSGQKGSLHLQRQVPPSKGAFNPNSVTPDEATVQTS